MTLWIDAILALMALEGAALLALRHFSGRGPSAILANLLAGMALLLAMRFALTGETQIWIAAALLAALLAHLADLRSRWR